MSARNQDRHTASACAHCGSDFLRDRNTQFCSDACRLLSKVDMADCWTWTATLDRHGYGTFYLGRNVGAHRASWTLFRGPIPAGLELDHLCRNRACVNPDHLEPVTRRINVLRGEAPTAVAFREGRCKNNHPRTPETTYRYGTKKQQCRVCSNAARNERRSAGRAA